MSERIHRHARTALPPSERLAQTRERRRAEGVTRLEIPVSAETLAEIDRRADEMMTSRGEVVSQAIEATRTKPSLAV